MTIQAKSHTRFQGPWLAWAMWMLSVALFMGYIALRIAVRAAMVASKTTTPLGLVLQTELSVFHFVGDIFLHIGYLAFSTLGVLILIRRSENRIGWIFCTIGFIQAVSEFATYYAIYALAIAPDSLPGGLAAGWLQNWTIAVTTGLVFIFLPLLFPNGRLLSNHWRIIGWLGIGTTILVAFWMAFHPGPLVTTALAALSDPLKAWNNPLAITALVNLDLNIVLWIGGGLLLACMLTAATSLILRFRQSAGDERQQIKWFAYIIALLAGVYIVGFPTKVLYLSAPSTYFVAIVTERLVYVGVAFIGLPIAAGLAILKYRLYKIDLLINRTLVYGALTASVVGLYVLIVGGLGTFLQTQSNLPGAIIAILLIAFLFHPLRQRLQNIANGFVPVLQNSPHSEGHDANIISPENTASIILRSHWLAWVLLVLTVGLTLLTLLLGFLNRFAPVPVSCGCTGITQVGDMAVGLALAIVGVLIASRRVRNPIGWILCISGLVISIWHFANGYAIYTMITRPNSLPGGEVMTWLSSWFIVPTEMMIFLLLLFPDGHLLSKRWQPVAWFAIMSIIVQAIGLMFKPGPLLARSVLPFVRNPFGIEGEVGAILTLVANNGYVFILAGMLAGILSLILRFRGAVGMERQQLKWFTYSATLSVIYYLVIIMIYQFYEKGFVESFGVQVLGPLPFIAVPVSMYIAILKYHLYDIDIIINRTLVYGALIVIVLGLYMFVVDMAGMLFQSVGNSLFAILATGLIAVLFHPLRQRLQRAINHLMYGERDDPYAVLSRLGQRLEAAYEPESVLPTIVETVSQTLKLPYAAISLNRDGDFKIEAEFGRSKQEPITLPLIYQGEPVGELILAPRGPGEHFTAAERQLLDNLARQAGVAAHAVRLRADLQRSRERLVAAREEERRRLRRDLHDGLGPQLASLALKLEAARNRMADDPQAAALLTDLSARTQEAVADIRRLVYALRPPALDELGLIIALREGTTQYNQQVDNGLNITFEAPESLPPLPAAVEVAVYRIAQEALTNVVRHAEAHTCCIRLRLDESACLLCLEVQDDGKGLPMKHRAGVGLNSMRERAEELGGTWAIESIPTGGARILVRLPCRLPDKPAFSTSDQE